VGGVRPPKPDAPGNGGRPDSNTSPADPSPADRPQAASGNETEEPRLARPSPNARPPRREDRGGSHGPHDRPPRLFAALLSADAAAALDIDTVAYDANVNPTVVYKVRVYMKPQKETVEVEGAPVNMTKVLLGFPAFTTLHYDPTVELTTPTNVGYTVDNTTTTAVAAKSAAPAVRMGVHAALGVVAALMLLI
jgi:hypothetical protein